MFVNLDSGSWYDAMTPVLSGERWAWVVDAYGLSWVFTTEPTGTAPESPLCGADPRPMTYDEFSSLLVDLAGPGSVATTDWFGYAITQPTFTQHRYNLDGYCFARSSELSDEGLCEVFADPDRHGLIPYVATFPGTSRRPLVFVESSDLDAAWHLASEDCEKTTLRRLTSSETLDVHDYLWDFACSDPAYICIS